MLTVRIIHLRRPLGRRAKLENMSQKPEQEEFKVSGGGLLEKVKELVHEGNVRRIIIKNEKSVTLLEVPLSIGLVGIALLPVWAAVGAVAALATDCTIVVVRKED